MNLNPIGFALWIFRYRFQKNTPAGAVKKNPPALRTHNQNRHKPQSIALIFSQRLSSKAVYCLQGIEDAAGVG